MSRYCFDTNFLIQAKNGPYGFDFAPSFWEFVDSKLNDGTIFTSKLVYDEIVSGDDELADWIKARNDPNVFVQPDENVQMVFADISNHVVEHYPATRSQEFLSSADPWIIALARVEDTIVVTHETLVPEESKKVKIPNICKVFEVRYIGPYEMLRILKARF